MSGSLCVRKYIYFNPFICKLPQSTLIISRRPRDRVFFLPPTHPWMTGHSKGPCSWNLSILPDEHPFSIVKVPWRRKMESRISLQLVCCVVEKIFLDPIELYWSILTRSILYWLHQTVLLKGFGGDQEAQTCLEKHQIFRFIYLTHYYHWKS